MTPATVGVDLGTGGARALVVDEAGAVLASAQQSLPRAATSVAGVRHEQDPGAWWEATASVLRALAAQLVGGGGSLDQLRGLAIDATSGTFVCVDDAGEAVRWGLMYDDLRAQRDAEAMSAQVGVAVAPAFAVAKMVWLLRHEPETVARTAGFVSQADYVARKLGARRGVTDYSNALKSGYDLRAESWAAWLDEFEDVRSRLPDVVAPGRAIGALSAARAAELGLPSGLPIVAGMTDGTAAFLASGARRPGDHNTTLGTTLVFKAVSDRYCADPEGLVYTHKLPGGLWLPGAASSTGGEWIRERHVADDLVALDRAAVAHLPCSTLSYPLARTGERFPFFAPAACGFREPPTEDPAVRYAADLQGVALLERLGYAVLDGLTGHRDGEVFATGGGARSDVWMQLRADVTGRVLHRPAVPESAFGSAVLAAAATIHGDLARAVEAMVRMDASFRPNGARTADYDRLYAMFQRELRTRGYLVGDAR